MDLNEHILVKKLRDQYSDIVKGKPQFNAKRELGIPAEKLQNIMFEKNKYKKELTFDEIFKIHNIFNVTFEEIVDYNAHVAFYSNKTRNQLKEDEELLAQYINGKTWEDEVIEYYNNKKYFVYKIPTMNKGTVFDIIVVKNGAALMIECKHIEGEKLYYKGSGLIKKEDELDNFIKRTGNNVYIYVKSDKTGTWWTTWKKSRNLLKERGYITIDDCFKCDLGGKEDDN